MAKWMIKALIQGGLSIIPGGRWINKCLQRLNRSGIGSKTEHLRRFEWCGKHLKNWFEQGNTCPPQTVLELGTGDFISVPLGMFLCGVERTITVDITRLIQPAYFYAMLHSLAEFSLPELQTVLPVDPARFAALQAILQKSGSMTVDEILTTLLIDYIQGDIRQMAFDPAGFDFIISNTTLEHIDLPILSGIFDCFAKVLKKNGVMSHFIDMSDHYEHFDHSISAYNYLKFSPAIWRLFNTPFVWQNRLRLRDYQQLHQHAGFTIIHQQIISRDLNALKSLRLAKVFHTYTIEELLPTHAWLISQKAHDPA